MKEEFNKKTKKLGKALKAAACTALVTGISLTSAFSSNIYAKNACERKYSLPSDIAICEIRSEKAAKDNKYKVSNKTNNKKKNVKKADSDSSPLSDFLAVVSIISGVSILGGVAYAARKNAASKKDYSFNVNKLIK